MSENREVIVMNSLDDIPKVAERIIEHTAEKNIVAFFAPMGAGKTTIIKEIARQLKVVDNVTSPTFALVNQYITENGEIINHFDFYRIEKIEEVYDLGYEEYFFGGDLCLIEWSEKIGHLIPEDALIVRIEPHPEKREGRTVTIS